MGKHQALRLIAGLLRREPGTSAESIDRSLADAVARAGLATRRYLDDHDIESLLYQVSLEGGALTRAALAISFARSDREEPSAA
ncbi:MAG: hypothetical protein R3C39_00170 [Dehalococcoidia bacterium]